MGAVWGFTVETATHALRLILRFAVDWPFNSNREGVEFIQTASITAEERSKIFAGNAADLLRI